jgi:hypothetical protein
VAAPPLIASSLLEDLPVELTINGIRMLVRMPSELPEKNADGTLTVSCEVLDVLEPPEARQIFLDEMNRRYGRTTS